jgi:hypothetical protein
MSMLSTATLTERHALARAVLRAAQRQTAITFRGPDCWLVTSYSHPGHDHLVTRAGHRLTCDCPARSICTHRATVFADLLTAAINRKEVA